MTGLCMKIDKTKKTRIFPAFLERLVRIIGFFFAIILSEKLLANPFFGGSLFICGQLVLLYLDILGKQSESILPGHERKKYIRCIPFILVIMLCLLILYPFLVKDKGALLVILFVALQFVGFYFLRGNGLLRVQDKYVESFEDEPDCTPEEISHMMNVHSYKFYWLMTANTKVAFETSILFTICYIPYLPFEGFWPLMADIAVLTTLYSLAAGISKLLLRKKRLLELGKNTVFIIFATSWILVNYKLHENYDKLNGFYFYLAYLILCISITALASIAISMESDMQIIGTLGIKGFTPRKFQILKALIDHLSTFYSRFTILVIIGFLTFFTELNPYKSKGTLFVLGKYGLTLLPAAFLVFGVLAAVKQPLTGLYEQKLKKYISLKKEGKTNKSLEERLRAVLIAKYRKRLGIRFLMILLKPLFYHRVVGKKNVDTKAFPSIFVCNHSQIYGPIAAILNFPFYIKPWILNEMIDNDKIAGHIQKGTFDRMKWLPKPIRDRAGKLFGPIIAWAMQSTEPIPVYRNDGRDVLKGITMSIEALEADDNILLFPENPFRTEGYVHEGVGEFFSGFVNIARDYYKKTGRAITFYSVYANKRKRTLTFSKGITFNPAIPYREEKEHITQYLHEAMVNLAGKPSQDEME